jgi:hypothetical protein
VSSTADIGHAGCLPHSAICHQQKPAETSCHPREEFSADDHEIDRTRPESSHVEDYPYQIEVACPSCSSSPSYRRYEGCCLMCEAMQMAEIDMQYGASPTGQSKEGASGPASGRRSRTLHPLRWGHLATPSPRYLWPVQPHHGTRLRGSMVGRPRMMP